MIEWLSANIGTIIVVIILIAVVAGIILWMRRDKKKGKSTCGCNCSTCQMHGACHQKGNPKQQSNDGSL